MYRTNAPPPTRQEDCPSPSSIPTTTGNLEVLNQYEIKRSRSKDDMAYITQIANLLYVFEEDAKITATHLRILEGAKMIEEPEDDDGSEKVIKSTDERLLSDAATTSEDEDEPDEPIKPIKESTTKTTAEEKVGAERIIERLREDFLGAKFFAKKLTLYLKDQELKMQMKESNSRVSDFVDNGH